MSKQRLKQILLLTACALVMLGLAVFLWKTGLFAQLRDTQQLQETLSAYGASASAAFFLLQLCSVVFAPIPSNVVALAGGMALGLWKGFLLTFLAVNLGSSITFLLSRTIGRDTAQRMVARKLPSKYQRLLKRKGTSFLIIAFLFPFFPDDLLCIMAGLTDISWKRFALIVLCTRHWGLLVSSALGSSLLTLPGWARPLLTLAGIGLFLLGILYGDRVERAVLRRIRRNAA
ncbi:MAG: TVP38/TMEM64 family protein [Clostridiales bacterium]|nr:TVP38/TMEM64 family protein [Clostridiales bacterium]